MALGVANDPIFGVPTQVGVIEITDIDVVDAMQGRPIGEYVPDNIVNCPGHQKMVRQLQFLQAAQHPHQDWLRDDYIAQRLLLGLRAFARKSQMVDHSKRYRDSLRAVYRSIGWNIEFICWTIWSIGAMASGSISGASGATAT